MAKILRLSCLLIGLSGCIDEQPVDLKSDPSRLVVDALISNKTASSYVAVGWSGPANETCTDEFGNIIGCGPVVQNGPYNINGVVRITEIETGTTVEMPFKMNDKAGMVQLAPDIQGQRGLTYSLEIRFDYNGIAESYSSTTTMLPTPVITDIGYEIRRGDVGKSDNLVPLISFTDPAEENFYLFQLCSVYFNTISCGNSRVWSYSLIADTFLPSQVRGLSIDDGASIAKYAEFYPSPQPNAGALVRMYSVDRITYDFYRSLIGQFNNDGGAYSPTPATPRGNISGNAVGLFRAVEESSAIVYF
jgi:hypothetical protein